MASFSPLAPQAPTVGPSTPLEISTACDDGKSFAELFYKTVDKSRHTIAGFYHESASLVWNGNRIQGKASVVSFYEKLPACETTLQSIDAQPVLNLPALGQQPTIMVICGGRQKFGTKYKYFTECFMLTAEAGKWKIVSDTYRYFE